MLPPGLGQVKHLGGLQELEAGAAEEGGATDGGVGRHLVGIDALVAPRCQDGLQVGLKDMPGHL